MAKKKIISVAAELATDDIEYCSFDSDSSLLDWDIILFKPVIYEFASYSDSYQGKPSLSDSSSFDLKERTEHWRREIKDAVLLGNAFRLEPLEGRSELFTTKCISAAKRSSTALVFTPDLFRVARYLSNKKDAKFATRCRKAILNTTGRVAFPEVPETSDALLEDATETQT